MLKSDFNKVALQSEMMPLKHRNITTAETLFIPELILLSFYTTGRFKTQTPKLSPTSCSSLNMKYETSCTKRKIGLQVSKLLIIKLNRRSTLTLSEDLSNPRT